MPTKKSFIFILLLLLCGISFLTESCALTVPSESESRQSSFELWKKTFKKQALKQGVHEDILNEVIPTLKLLNHVLVSDQKQNEFLLTFWDYTDKTISEQRVKKGKEMLQKYGSLLKDISQKYGVPPRYIIAFWGMETNYGTYKGNIKTTDALATLAFDKRRRTFFTNELIALLKIMQTEEKVSFYGSWAGAFGNFQFMPTTYAFYAVDADGDGKKDIINSLPDAFTSAANYLSQMGWEKDLNWGQEVQLPLKIDWNKIYASPKKTIAEWETIGLRPVNNFCLPNDKDIKAKLVLPMGINGPAFLTYSNFDRIMRWNNSTLYALSVGILSDKINSDDFTIYHPRVNHHFYREDIKIIQKGLAKRGYYKGPIDGILGKGSKNAIRLYQKEIQMDQDSYPSKELLNKLKKDD